MIFVDNNVEFLDIAEPGKKIEKVGRTCYKSDSAIADKTYETFIKGIIKRGHTSVLEAERKLFCFDASIYEAALKEFFEYEHYFNVTFEGGNVFVSGNIRSWYNLLKDIDGDSSPCLQSLSTYLSKDYPYIFRDFGLYLKCLYGLEAEKECKNLDKHKEYTFKIICSRTCSHQLVRHRSLSFAQQSQRYCNYANDKFGHSISFVKNCVPNNSEVLIQELENKYFELIENGTKPEDARQILPNCAATEICITGTKDDWKKFCYLRSDSHAQKEIRNISDTIMSYLRLTKTEIGL